MKSNENMINKEIAFLKELNGNEKLLRLLSSDRLKRLIAYYDNVIEKNNETIRRLNNS